MDLMRFSGMVRDYNGNTMGNHGICPLEICFIAMDNQYAVNHGSKWAVVSVAM